MNTVKMKETIWREWLEESFLMVCLLVLYGKDKIVVRELKEIYVYNTGSYSMTSLQTTLMGSVPQFNTKIRTLPIGEHSTYR